MMADGKRARGFISCERFTDDWMAESANTWIFVQRGCTLSICLSALKYEFWLLSELKEI